jgi:mRNA-degrading endonuclease RelE of RelBE toxin-antitoxin system
MSAGALMAFEIEITEGAQDELEDLRAFDHRRVLESIATHLTTKPNVETRLRKNLGDGMTADFEYVPPLWELKVGEYRAFYEVSDAQELVVVHAVRRKPPHKTTAEVLNEGNQP